FRRVALRALRAGVRRAPQHVAGAFPAAVLRGAASARRWLAVAPRGERARGRGGSTQARAPGAPGSPARRARILRTGRGGRPDLLRPPPRRSPLSWRTKDARRSDRAHRTDNPGSALVGRERTARGMRSATERR